KPLALQRALLDLGPRVVGLVTEIGRPAIDGDGEYARRRAAAAQLRLEVAGEACRSLHDQRSEILLEELPRTLIVARSHRCRMGADLPPLGGGHDPLAAVGGDARVGRGIEPGAGTAECRQRL